MRIRPGNESDQAEWLRLRRLLWPECAAARHALEMKMQTADPARYGLMVLDGGDRLGGFLELSIRHGVDGARSEDVGYVEGWYVEPAWRGQGHGRALIEAAVRWAAERGLSELGSDAELANEEGIAAHKALGFRETFRLVLLLKEVPPR